VRAAPAARRRLVAAPGAPAGAATNRKASTKSRNTRRMAPPVDVAQIAEGVVRGLLQAVQAGLAGQARFARALQQCASALPLQQRSPAPLLQQRSSATSLLQRLPTAQSQLTGPPADDGVR